MWQGGGGFAEYALLGEGAAAIRPPSVSEEDAASLPVAGLSALQPLRDYCGVPLPGSKEWKGEGDYKGHVLVANASGGVGHFAVQVRARSKTLRHNMPFCNCGVNVALSSVPRHWHLSF